MGTSVERREPTRVGLCGGCRDLYLARAFDGAELADSTAASCERHLAAAAARELLDPAGLARA